MCVLGTLQHLYYSIKKTRISEKDIFIYDGHDALVMKITQPLREIGYEGSVSTLEEKLATGIGPLEKIRRTDSANLQNGMMHYSWGGGVTFGTILSRYSYISATGNTPKQLKTNRLNVRLLLRTDPSKMFKAVPHFALS